MVKKLWKKAKAEAIIGNPSSKKIAKIESMGLDDDKPVYRQLYIDDSVRKIDF
jgi:hypothetical protein